MGQESPPKWSLRLLRLIIHGEYLEEIEGDMQEVFFDDLEIYSLKKARRNYSRGVANLFRISLIKNLKWINKIGLIVTIMRTIRLAFRNLLKFKTHSAVNLVGLSLGLAISSLILLYVLDELSFDNFHTKGDRIYKVVTNASNGEMETNAHPVGYQLRTNFPEVEAVVYTRNASSTFKVNHKNERFAHDIYYAGEEFFQIFSFELLAGNAEEVLKAPYSVVITESLEDVYFDGDALGKTLKMRDSIDFKVTGVVEKLPPNSHIQFDILISFSTFPDFRYFSLTDGWGNFDVRNYLLLNEGVEINEFESKISSIYDDNVGEWLSEMGMSMSVALLPLKELYLNDSYWNGFGPNGSEKKVKTVSVIAFFLLVLACINYINLSTARSAYRAKEVGMKKVVGSSKQGIVGQFMMESFLLTIISFAFALILIIGSLPFFNDLMLKEYTAISLLSKEYIAGISMLLLVVAFLSGYYPALIISELKPLQALSGKLSKTYKGLNLRKGLIAFQFFISSGLVLATLLVVDQIEYMRTHELGFDKDQILVINATSTPSGSAREVMKNELAALSGVEIVSYNNALPGRPGWQGQWAYPEKISDQHVSTEYMAVDESYLTALGLELIAGKNFDLTKPSELESGLIINETCVREMGWANPEDAIGRHIVSPSQTPQGTVIGVVKDYHGTGLQENIWPKVMDYSGKQYGRYYAIRYDVSQTYDLIKNIENKWDEVYGSYPLKYFFLDEEFDLQYRSENQLAKVLSIFSVIVVIVSAIGLLGLISFVALSKTKEVGIRKTLGANVQQIIYILSKEFVFLVVVGNLLSVPFIWYFGQKWLNDFAYHTSINPTIFVITILATAFIAFITISFQTMKTAKMNPVKALRYE